MSKLFSKYSELKKQNPNFVYLFKVGIFYLALDEDAHTLSNTLKLNLGKLNENVVKVRFSCYQIRTLYSFATSTSAFLLKLQMINMG